MASKGEHRRRLIRRRLAESRHDTDIGTSLKDRIVGEPSPAFSDWLARPHREAAVLLGLIGHPGGPRVLLTERAGHLRDHPGQVSFPGGRLHAGEDAELAALREAEEEVALPRSQVTVLGRMAPQLTGTGFVVTPIVGWIDPGFAPRPDPSEVQAAFEVPLAHLSAPGNRRRSTRVLMQTRFVTDEFYFDRFLIWGATASILNQFLEIINEKTI